MKELLIAGQRRALEAFRKQYPSITSADMQSFLLGYQAAIDIAVEIESLKQEEDLQMAKLG